MVERWSHISQSGVEGDPKSASAEKGKAFAELEIENLIKVCQVMRDIKAAPERSFNFERW